jgi:hypothetical protein
MEGSLGSCRKLVEHIRQSKVFDEQQTKQSHTIWYTLWLVPLRSYMKRPVIWITQEKGCEGILRSPGRVSHEIIGVGAQGESKSETKML